MVKVFYLSPVLVKPGQQVMQGQVSSTAPMGKDPAGSRAQCLGLCLGFEIDAAMRFDSQEFSKQGCS